jgi:16S rRNA (adenine1518-N6/adenine1519-N6)-dimethyltransferase
VLEERGLRPRRRLGQNFLVDPNALEAIVRDADPRPGETILEVGPGPGILTERLLAAGASVVAVEVDPAMADLATELLDDPPGLLLLRTDVLRGKHRIEPAVLEAVDRIRAGGPWRVVANLPYQVASPVTADLVALADPPRDVVVMVQAEVADRMIARPGSPAYGPLAAALALAARVERLRDLPPDVFWPRPRIRSSVVRIRPDPATRDARGSWPAAEAFLRAVFLHRRKTLRFGLTAAGHDASRVDAAIRDVGLAPDVRAEAVSPEVLDRLRRSLEPESGDPKNG